MIHQQCFISAADFVIEHRNLPLLLKFGYLRAGIPRHRHGGCLEYCEARSILVTRILFRGLPNTHRSTQRLGDLLNYVLLIIKAFPAG